MSARTAALALAVTLLLGARAGAQQATAPDDAEDEGELSGDVGQLGDEAVVDEPVDEPVAPYEEPYDELPAHDEPPAPPDDGVEVVHVRAVMAERLEAARVEYSTAWVSGRGYLVGDGRTVVVHAMIPHTGRRIVVRRPGEAGTEVRVARVEVTDREGRRHGFTVLRLASALPGVPLELAPTEPYLGQMLFVGVGRGGVGRRHRNEGSLAVAETTVSGLSDQAMSFGGAALDIPAGAPVLDENGGLVAFAAGYGLAALAGDVLDEEELRARGRPLVPVWGVRLGTEFGGFLERPFVMDFDFGLALWDQLGIGLRLGFGVGTDDTYLVPPTALRGAGVAQGDHGTFNLGVEVEYRILVNRASLPFYIDLSVGLQYVLSIIDPRGPAFYATEPGCDPYGEDCGLTVGPAPSRAVDHGVGPSFGLDVRAGMFTIGYRFIPEALSLGLSNTHRLTFGLTAF